MDVTEAPANGLTIEGGLPGWLGVFFLFPLFVAMVLAALWQPTTLVCERGGECTLASAGFLGEGVERFPAASLRGAEVATIRSGRRNTTYQVVLALDAGKQPMSTVSTSDREAMADEARRINAFVAGTGGSRLVIERDASALLAAAVAMAALGLALLYFVPRGYRTVIDGDEGQVRHRVTWLGLGRERRLALGDVTGVDLRRSLWINGRRWMRAALQTSGRPLVLGYGPDDRELADQVARIREVL